MRLERRIGAQLGRRIGAHIFDREFAGRFTEGHFDIPVRNCTIALDGDVVVDQGRLVA